MVQIIAIIIYINTAIIIDMKVNNNLSKYHAPGIYKIYRKKVLVPCELPD